jgi:hypothetical protein
MDNTMHPRTLSLRTLAFTAGVLLTLVACTTGPKVRSDFDKSIDFAQYQTFAFATPLGTDRAGYQTIVTQHLKTATRREMEARGLQYSESSPQLLLNFNGMLNEKLRVESVPTSSLSVGVGYGRGYYGYRGDFYSPWPRYATETEVSSYTEGTLNIDVIDAARKQMVWEGVAVGSVTQKTRDNLQTAIDTTVSAIFKKFPKSTPSK